jgi:chemotaxis protein CheD
MRVLSQGGFLWATIGPGFGLALLPGKGPGGGLLHLNLQLTKISQSISDPQQTARQLDAFLAECRNQDLLYQGARVRLVGGSDNLRIYSTHSRNNVLGQVVNTFKELLSERGLSLKKVTTGGLFGRRVVVDCDQSKVIVHIINPQKRTLRRKLKSVGPIMEFSQPVEPKFTLWTVDMGCMKVAHAPDRFTAILGSCVGVALYDQHNKCGGLVHIMLPRMNGKNDNPLKYADSGICMLRGKMIEEGAQLKYIQAKIAGGANVLHSPPIHQFNKIGENNVEEVCAVLKRENIPLLEQQVGGQKGRKIWFDLQDFTLKAKVLI